MGLQPPWQQYATQGINRLLQLIARTGTLDLKACRTHYSPALCDFLEKLLAKRAPQRCVAGHNPNPHPHPHPDPNPNPDPDPRYKALPSEESEKLMPGFASILHDARRVVAHTYYSLRTTYNSLLTTYYSLLTTYY